MDSRSGGPADRASEKYLCSCPTMDRVAFAPSKTIEDDRLIPPRGAILGYPRTTLLYDPSRPLDRRRRLRSNVTDRAVAAANLVDDTGRRLRW